MAAHFKRACKFMLVAVVRKDDTGNFNAVLPTGHSFAMQKIQMS